MKSGPPVKHHNKAAIPQIDGGGTERSDSLRLSPPVCATSVGPFPGPIDLKGTKPWSTMRHKIIPEVLFKTKVNI